MRSKFDQKLRYESMLTAVEISTASVSPEIAHKIIPRRGRMRGSWRQARSHSAVKISMMIRNAKFLPVINGKKRELETMSGIKRSA
ncbi:MAG: hypothetical protein AAB922_06915 [Patescibacteria group bacterium]